MMNIAQPQHDAKHDILSLILWLGTVSWMIFMTIILLQPENQPIVNTGIPPAPPSFKRELFFSSIHLIFFGFTAGLWGYTLRQHLQLKQALLLASILIIGYGVLTEILQGRTPGRSPQLIDLIANTLGVMIGVFVCRWTIMRNK